MAVIWNEDRPKSALARLIDEQGKKADYGDQAEVGVAFDEEDTISKPLKTNLSNVNTHTAIQQINAIVKTIDPHRCRLWRFADRPEDELGNIDELGEGIKKSGQQQPVLARPVEDDPSIDFEIIFGNRRWRACKKFNLPLTVEIRDITDQEAALCQKEENQNRENLSDLAKARSYKALLEAGIFLSESELSKSLGISIQSMNDIMSFIRIPEKLAHSIPNFKDISRKTAIKLAKLSKDKKILGYLINLAVDIGNKKITASNIEDIIAKKSLNKKEIAGKQHRNQAIKVNDDVGDFLFSLKRTVSGETIVTIDKLISQKYGVNALKTLLYETLLNLKEKV